MRQRSISAVGVVIVGLVPAFMGGPVFALVFATLGILGVLEYQGLAARLTPKPIAIGLLAVPAFALAAYLDPHRAVLAAITTAVFVLPFIIVIFRSSLDGAVTDWAVSAAGGLYLGLPIYAVIAMREMTGDVDRNWIRQLSEWSAPGWEAAPRGLAWLLFVIIVTWMSDTGAYLIGRSMGRRPLIPVVSPKKTVEGLIGGLASACVTAVIANTVFGLGLGWWVALPVGLAIAVVGVFGDLAESVIKRQAGVKDSGTLIPGHGGILDRLDAMYFTWPVGWCLALLVDSLR